MPNASLHHIGFVVGSAEESVTRFCSSLGAKTVSEVFDDPLQQAKVVFMNPDSSDGVKIELVAPMGPSSPVAAFVQKGGGLHHLCYEVDDLDAELQDARKRKLVLLRPPKPAVAFGGRRIAWVITPERLLIEYLERAAAPGTT